ncbi:MAG: energy transducer TonB, partial [Bergeyella zoohelcum]|nr:energy transducer TonB [Bergeyella zoohelcum]
FFGTAFFVVAAFTPIIMMKIKELTPKDKKDVKIDMVLIEEQPIIEEEIIEDTPPPPPPPPVEEEKIEIIQNVVPEPKKTPQVETPPPPISVQKETTTGLVAQEGVKTPTYTPPPPPPSTGTKTATVEAKPAVSTTEVYTQVDQESEFPGGLNAFRSSVSQNFDTSVMEGGEGTLKTEITFVVERDGTISQVKATGSNSDFNREAERTVKSIKKKWTPAKINGQPVRSRFRLPLTMNFE